MGGFGRHVKRAPGIDRHFESLGFEGADGELQLRPGFAAFATLQKTLEGATFVGPIAAPTGSRLYHFRRADGTEWIAGWSAEDRSAEIVLPRPASLVLSRDGQELTSTGETVGIDAAPRYFRLEPE